jgi:isocitrate/isopropylmalate dehydrogenase
MAHKITLIPGDGIGSEVTQAVVRILEATGLKFEMVVSAVYKAFEMAALGHDFQPCRLSVLMEIYGTPESRALIQKFS